MTLGTRLKRRYITCWN